MNKFKVKENDVGRSILKYLERMLSDVPKSRIEKAFRNKDIKINSKRTNDKKIILKLRDTIEIYGIQFETKVIHLQPLQRKFTVIHEDKNILIINKEVNVQMSDVVDSLDNQVLNYLHFKNNKDSFVPSSIGRLDKVTSGLVVYAKNYFTLRELKTKSQFFIKKYYFKSDLPESITTNYKIQHDENYKREISGDEGKITKSIFEVEKNKKIAIIKTGRKHQIRSALSKLGFPIYGDVKYGGKKDKRVYLHSFSIKFQNLEGKASYLNDKEFICMPKW